MHPPGASGRRVYHSAHRLAAEAAAGPETGVPHSMSTREIEIAGAPDVAGTRSDRGCDVHGRRGYGNSNTDSNRNMRGPANSVPAAKTKLARTFFIFFKPPAIEGSKLLTKP